MIAGLGQAIGDDCASGHKQASRRAGGCVYMNQFTVAVQPSPHTLLMQTISVYYVIPFGQPLNENLQPPMNHWRSAQAKWAFHFYCRPPINIPNNNSQSAKRTRKKSKPTHNSRSEQCDRDESIISNSNVSSYSAIFDAYLSPFYVFQVFYFRNNCHFS